MSLGRRSVMCLVWVGLGLAASMVSANSGRVGATAQAYGHPGSSLSGKQSWSGDIPTVSRTYLWNGAWTIDGLATTTFDGQGRPLEFLIESWEANLLEWFYDSKLVNTYSGSDWPSEQLLLFWTGGSWEPLSRITYQYDGTGSILLQTTEEYSTGSWENLQRESWTRDGLGKPIEHTVEQWVNGAWANVTRTVFNFNGDFLNDKEEYFWTAGGWQVAGRSLYSYGPYGETEERIQFWSGADWYDSQRYQTEYGAGRPVAYTYQVWFGAGWLNQSREIFDQHDAQGRLLVQISQRWIGLAWENEVRTEFDYGIPTAVGEAPWSSLPSGLALHQNYPNPFNPSTVISFTLPGRSDVSVVVVDMLGRTVATLYTGTLAAGEHSVTWDGRSAGGQRAASGVYFYRVVTDDGAVSRKMMLLK